jgi:septal ring factor EnvC (AmiA/AmiB activator)
MAQHTLKYFRENGFYVLEKDGDQLKVVRRTITEEQYNQLNKRFKKLNNYGETQKEASERQEKEQALAETGPWL